MHFVDVLGACLGGRRAGLLWLGLMALAAPGCGSSNNPPPADGGAALQDGGAAADGGSLADAGAAAERCRARWQVLCQAWSTCGSSAPFFSLSFPDVNACVAAGTEQCGRFLALAPTGISYPLAEAPAGFVACTTAIARHTACEIVNTYVFGSNTSIDPECAAKTGTLADGAGCTFADQCQSQYCRFENGCSTCAQQADEGGSCVTNADCKVGFACASNACSAYAQTGDSCGATAPCQPGLTCVGARCGAALAIGAACNPRAANPCNLGYCNQGTCEALKFDGQPGGACGIDVATGSLTLCARGSRCVFVTQSYQGVCVAEVKRGDRCYFDTGFQGSQCEVFTQCVNGVCSSPPEPTCGQDGGPTPARRDGGILPAADAGSDLATETSRQVGIVCDAIYACPRWAAQAANWFGSRADCTSGIGRIASYNLATPRSGLTAAEARVCDDALVALPACEQADRLLGVKPGLAVCDGTAGPLAAGAVCSGGMQCSATARCMNGVLDPLCGACINLAGDGGVCAFPEDCPRGSNCANGRCRPGGGASATCSAAAPCARDFVCNGGTCTSPAEVGAACNPSASACAQPLYCNTVSRQCELPQLAGQQVIAVVDGGASDGGVTDADAGLADAGLADAGAVAGDGGVAGTPCGLLNGGFVICPHGFQCKLTNLRNTTGVCDPAGNVGDACAWTGGLDGRGACRFPSQCLNSVCTFGDRTYCQ